MRGNGAIRGDGRCCPPRFWALHLPEPSSWAGNLSMNWLTDRSLQRIEAAPDEPNLVSDLATMGDRGMEALVGLLNAKNVKTAAAAKRVLVEEIRRWRTLDRPAHTPKVAVLARALAQRVGLFCPDAKRDAAELATFILLDFQAAVHGAVAADCETVLRASLHLRQVAGRVPADNAPSMAMKQESPGPSDNPPVGPAESTAELAGLNPVLDGDMPLTPPPAPDSTLRKSLATTSPSCRNSGIDSLSRPSGFPPRPARPPTALPNRAVAGNHTGAVFRSGYRRPDASTTDRSGRNCRSGTGKTRLWAGRTGTGAPTLRPGPRGPQATPSSAPGAADDRPASLDPSTLSRPGQRKSA